MFVMGLIVGIVIGMVIAVPILYYAGLKMYNMSTDEARDVYSMIYDASWDRESKLLLVRDDDVEDEVILEEK
jgi:hypothetical protein